MNAAQTLKPASLKRGRRSPPEVSPQPRLLPPMDRARRLNLEADVEMQRGHHDAAERLARRAAELRGWAV